MEEPSKSFRGGFFERWIILNLAILLACFMMIMAISQIKVLEQMLDRILLFSGVLILFPVNIVYLFGSMHLSVKYEWEKHRRFWLFLVGFGLLWTFTILAALALRQLELLDS